VIRLLLLIVGLLATLDIVLFWKKHAQITTRAATTTTTSASHFFRNSNSLRLSHAESQQLHQHVERQPPLIENDVSVMKEEEDIDIDADKEPIYDILRQANIHPKTLDDDTRRQLPTWSTVQRLYGTEPRIYGLDTCQQFRDITSAEPSLTFLAMAGAFNSGTNLLAQLMIQNCQVDERMKKYGERQRGIRWQVKWGKHTPPKYREQHVTRTDGDVPLEYELPLITIRDPYNWMQSMCRHPYEAHWAHSKEACPGVWNDEEGRTSQVYVNYGHNSISEHHESLPAMWNDWYNAYRNVTWPRVFVRMEDLIFHGQNVTESLCQCGGGSPRQKRFKHIASSAKLGTAQHGKDKTSLLSAIIRYGTDRGRLEGMTPKDLQVTRDILDPTLMDIFNYQYA
jgi:hypothetical protein